MSSSELAELLTGKPVPKDDKDMPIVGCFDGKLYHLSVLGVKTPEGYERVLVLVPTREYADKSSLGRDLHWTKWRG